MVNKPICSVIIPMYNAENFINDTLKTVYNLQMMILRNIRMPFLYRNINK